MTHSKIFTRPDGTKIKVKVWLYIENFVDNFMYNLSVTICPPGKRKFVNAVDTDSHTFRMLGMNDRAANIAAQQSAILTAAEILEAKMGLWEKLKPV